MGQRPVAPAVVVVVVVVVVGTMVTVSGEMHSAYADLSEEAAGLQV